MEGRPTSPRRRPHPELEATSFASTPSTRHRMQVQRSRDTNPELLLRRHLHARGWRFRVDRPPLAGVRRRADIVFGGQKVAIFVDGCFWHACPQHGTWPKTNADWWRHKLERNQQRDQETDQLLKAAGWSVIRIWEHEGVSDAAQRVEEALADRRSR